MKTFDGYRVTSEEYLRLVDAYGKLCWKAAHELRRMNSNNNHTDEIEDIYQELCTAMIVAVHYFKRQTYTQRCFKALHKSWHRGVSNAFLRSVAGRLEDLWLNRSQKGQRFGPHHEALLDSIVGKVVPKAERPSREDPLVMDAQFGAYLKSIVWNRHKALGKKITREKPLRNSLCSISEHSYLGGL